jgi:hypothetical protein
LVSGVVKLTGKTITRASDPRVVLNLISRCCDKIKQCSGCMEYAKLLLTVGNKGTINKNENEISVQARLARGSVQPLVIG